MLLISPNTAPCRAGSCTTTFAWFIQEGKDKVWDIVREGNEVEKTTGVEKTTSVEKHMVDLQLPLLVLMLHELKHQYEGAG